MPDKACFSNRFFAGAVACQVSFGCGPVETESEAMLSNLEFAAETDWFAVDSGGQAHEWIVLEPKETT